MYEQSNNFEFYGQVGCYSSVGGKGIVLFSNQATYKGEFSNGLMNGEGIMIFANGDVHQGKFTNGIQESLKGYI